MKMTKKKVFIVALAICLAAIGSMGSLAWFSSQDSVTNSFYIAESDDNDPDDIFSVDVYEIYDDERYDVGINYEDILPGDELEKNVFVENTGHYDQYIRVIITISDKAVWKNIIEDSGYNFDTYDIRQHFVGFNSSDWDLEHSTMDNTGENIQYVLYYKDILQAEEAFNVFTGVKIPKAMTAEHASTFDDDGSWGFTIDVKAQAVQTENVGANSFEAFQTVDMAIN